jgi:6-phospho-beta-glucosidase
MERFCPGAWLINFTNPSGIITETILTQTPIRAIGLCNVPIGMQFDIAEAFGCPVEDVYCDFVGLNHLVWAAKILVKDENVTSFVLEHMHDSAGAMKNIPNLSLSYEFLLSLGMLPCDYLKYYYLKREMLDQCLEDAEGEGVRGEVIKGLEQKLFELYQDPDLHIKPPQLAARGGAHYSDAACNLMSAIYNDKREIQVVNVQNRGTIEDLPTDAVIERNCFIGKDGATPIPYGHMPERICGLVQIVKAYERLTIEAALHGDRGVALQALTLHPLVDSADVAQSMLDELIQANARYLPQFRS